MNSFLTAGTVPLGLASVQGRRRRRVRRRRRRRRRRAVQQYRL